ncbi:MAG: hypothetical protein IPP86_06710 [Bacteroidetes bacterium]|nr:hypothetical protein [Bacteroidota bacterium]
MTTIPSYGLENHPAFTLGHLVSKALYWREDLGDSFEMPEKWKELFYEMVRVIPESPIRIQPISCKEILLRNLYANIQK